MFLGSNSEMGQTFTKMNTLKMFSGPFLPSFITVFQLLFSKIRFLIKRPEYRMQRSAILFPRKAEQ